MTTPKPLLVLGGTGKQGKKLITTILASSSKDSFTILALTRNPESASAKALAARSSTIKLIKGNLDDVPSVFKAALEATNGEKIWGVFCVLLPAQDRAGQDGEVKQGQDMIDGAVANDVQVFVYTSVDRHGVKSDSNPTFVPHFASKHKVELYLKEKADGKMTWTILRPTAFMDLLTPDFMGKAFATFIKVGLRPSRKLAFVATSDIGFFAAQAFLQPDSPEYKQKAISLAGDEVTMEELQQIFKQKQGYELPTTYEFLGRILKWMLTEINVMFRWFDEEGYEVDIPKLKGMNPGLMSFGDWLEKEGGFPVKK